VLGLGERGRELLYRHGYDIGEGFVDVLSQYQSLEEAHRAGRLRELPELLESLKAVKARAARTRRSGERPAEPKK
jgi:hypothetical protein